MAEASAAASRAGAGVAGARQAAANKTSAIERRGTGAEGYLSRPFSAIHLLKNAAPLS